MNEDLPEGWSARPLQAIVCHTLGGDWGKGPDDKEPQAIRVGVVRGTEFKHWSRSRAATAATRFIKPSSLEKRRLRNGDLVVEVSGGGPQQPVGRVLRIDQAAFGSFPDPLVCSNFCRQVRVLDAVDSAFVELGLKYHYATGKLDQIQTSTTNLRNLDFDAFLSLELPVAPIAEQRRIVEKVEALLEQVNQAKARLDRVTLILKKFRQSVLAAACSGELTREWRQQQPKVGSAQSLLMAIATRRAELHLPSSIRTIPDEGIDIPERELPSSWAWCRVGQFADVRLGGTPSRKESSYWNGHIPWVSSGEVANCRIKGTVEYITKKGLENSSAKLYPPNTVLIAMIGEGKTRGQAAILDIEAATNQNSAGLVFDVGMINPEFVWYWALQEYAKNRDEGRGGNQPALNGGKVRALPVPLPPVEEQNEIVRTLQAMFGVADLIEQRVRSACARADRLPQSILAKALSGELVPTEAELSRIEDRPYETAEVLLKRVTAFSAQGRLSRKRSARAAGRPQ
jgi:type I restriction enzyme S subunit